MRAIAWFSCGGPSAIAAKMAVEKYGDDCIVVYCDLSNDEHPDNLRFLADVETWLGVSVLRLKSTKYKDRYAVYDGEGWLIGPKGAKCTTILKRDVRRKFQRYDDIHVWGYTLEESLSIRQGKLSRVEQFEGNNPELTNDWILVDNGITRKDCYQVLSDAGIARPAMYDLGYKNNNCIGCVKGGMGYWNKIRIDFPEAFEKMAIQERKMNVACCKKYRGEKRIRVFLDELPPNAGRYESEPSISCGPVCSFEQLEMELAT